MYGGGDVGTEAAPRAPETGRGTEARAAAPDCGRDGPTLRGGPEIGGEFGGEEIGGWTVVVSDAAA